MRNTIRALAAALTLIGLSSSLSAASPATAPATRSSPSTTAPASQPTPLAMGDSTRSVDVEGRKRTFLVHVPPNYDAKKPTPVVLAFHGAMMNGQMMAWFCGLSKTADANNFIVVYPNGTGVGDTVLFFNAFLPAGRGQIDDVAFTGKLLDDLEAVANVDKKRVFATGMSNGGFMSYRLAAELSDRIAAIAPVAGTLAIPNPKPTRPVSVLHFHGSADNIVPFAGGGGGRVLKNFVVPGVDKSVETFAKLNGCPDEPRTSEIPGKNDDGTSIKKRVYGPGKEGSEVVLYIVENGGHTWPGQPAPAFIGKTTTQISANDLIWEFFQKHPMK